MAEFTKKTLEDGKVVYHNETDNKDVKKSSLSDELIARLDVAEEGTKVPESADIDEKANPAAKSVKKTSKTETVNLAHPLLINGKVYRANEDIEVPADVAKDLKRMDKEHGQYEQDLLRSQNKAREASQVKPSDVRE